MTPAARVQTAIELLDEIIAGTPAEKVLTSWARRSRFAGSKDRAAVRDHVFDVLRQRNSCGVAGGAADGRGLMLGLLRLTGVDPAEIFTGSTYAPSRLSAAEAEGSAPRDVVDLPDWLVPQMQASLGEDFARTELALRARAPVMLRVNAGKIGVAEAIAALGQEGVEAVREDIATTALRVRDGARRVRSSLAYQHGLVELQDGSSQAAMEALEVGTGGQVLDLCAGGGGKTLALAARHKARFFAHDIDAGRLADLPARAKRAGVEVALLTRDGVPANAPFDMVLCDVPCSGSGTWRRSPDMKWKFDSNMLRDLLDVQDDILDQAAKLTSRTGGLVYMTCSLLQSENEDRVAAFLGRTPGWTLVKQHRWPVSEAGDGFFLAHLKHD